MAEAPETESNDLIKKAIEATLFGGVPTEKIRAAGTQVTQAENFLPQGYLESVAARYEPGATLSQGAGGGTRALQAGDPSPVPPAPTVAAPGGTVAKEEPVKTAAPLTPVPPTTADSSAPPSDQREIPCPNCTGTFLVKYAGRVFSSICGFLQKTFNIRVEIIETVKSYVIERLPVSKRTAFQNGVCPVCEGKGTLTDPSDDRAKYAESAAIAQTYTQEIEQNEAKLGTGGNRYTIIQNHEVKEVGLGMNDVESYRVDYDKGYRNWGLAGWGKGGVDPNYGPIPKGAKKNHVQGTNPIASPGGQYTIKCSNKFTLVCGALGVDITTGGPVTIKGGITRITGPEITIGTQTGTLGLEGEVINMKGKSVEVAPTDGHFIVRGTISNTGNLIVGGHGHLESASVVKLETVGRNEPSKVSSSNNLYCGPAFWGGPAIEGARAAAEELLAYVISNTTNPELAKGVASPRYAEGLLDNITNLIYVSSPQELVPTGYCIVGGVRVDVFNYPHIHAQFDQQHYHETRIPDIDCTADTAQELRARQSGVEGPAPLHKKSTSILDVARSIWSVIGLPFIGVWSSLAKNIQKKAIG